MQNQGEGRGPTLAWPGWKQPDIPVEVDTDRLETSRSEAGVLKKLSLAGIAIQYRTLSLGIILEGGLSAGEE